MNYINLIPIFVALFSFNYLAVGQTSDTISLIPYDMKCGKFKDGSYVITNMTDFKLLRTELSDHSACLNYVDPTIDFEKYSLIGVVQSTGGCSPPELAFGGTDISGKIHIKADIAFLGGCFMLFHISKWFLIPRVVGKDDVEFEIIKHPK